jgi:hypothetical protein
VVLEGKKPELTASDPCARVKHAAIVVAEMMSSVVIALVQPKEKGVMTVVDAGPSHSRRPHVGENDMVQDQGFMNTEHERLDQRATVVVTGEALPE